MFIKLRFGTIPILSALVAISGFVIALFGNKELGAYLIIFAFVMFVIGLFLIIYFPKKEDQSKFTLGHKFIVLGFTLFSFPIVIKIILSLNFGGFIFQLIGSLLLIFGIIKLKK